MRPGNNNNNRRGRNRGPRKPHSGGMPNKNQNFDGGGSDTRVRGNVYQVLEKYLQLARDAGVAGDRVAAENFLQHADHYYRVITTMNDGQRPRVGGREISVADVNVQNVSQGLSAALYSGGPSQPNMSDTGNGSAPQQGNGNPRGNDGFNGGQGNTHGGNQHAGNSQGDNGQNEAGQGENNRNDSGRGDGGRNDNGRNDGGRNDGGRNDHGRSDNRRGNNAHADQQSRNGNASDDQGNDAGNGGDYAQPAPHRANRGRVNNAGNRNAPAYGNSGNNTSPVQIANGNGQEAVVRETVVTPVAAPVPAPTSDDQPDYPEHLLPPAAPEAPAEGARAPRDASRAPRGRLRTRRPRQGSEGEGEGAVADVAVPTTEDSE